jgi:hypothetical protein
MDIIFPSVLDFKTSLSKKLVFALANVIDTDQGNPFEVAVSYCLKRIYIAWREVILLAYR